MIKSRRVSWAGHVSRMEEGSSAFYIYTGKPTGKRSLGRPRHKLKDNISKDNKGMASSKNLIDLAHDCQF